MNCSLPKKDLTILHFDIIKYTLKLNVFMKKLDKLKQYIASAHWH